MFDSDKHDSMGCFIVTQCEQTRYALVILVRTITVSFTGSYFHVTMKNRTSCTMGAEHAENCVHPFSCLYIKD